MDRQLVIGFFALLLIGAGLLWFVDLIRTKRCPVCREKIASGARKCPKCQSDLPDD